MGFCHYIYYIALLLFTQPEGDEIFGAKFSGWFNDGYMMVMGGAVSYLVRNDVVPSM